MANTFKNAGVAVGTGRTTVYTTPAATSTVVNAIYLSNVDGSASVDASLEQTVDGGVTYFYIGKTIPVPPDSTLVIDKAVNLEAGDILAATASATGDLQCVVGVLEIT
tara:strand:- start:72 stop:395 length:324 start_codon:yes stop_codon:yes gene_type:complete